MHLSGAFIQSDVQYSQAKYFFFYQYVCSLGIEPTTFWAANAMLYHWATGTPQCTSQINAQSKANDFFQKCITKLLIQFLATSWLNMWSHTDVKQTQETWTKV